MAAAALSGAVGAHETPSLHAPADGLSPTEGLTLTVGVVVAPLHPTTNAAHRSEAISGGTIRGKRFTSTTLLEIDRFGECAEIVAEREGFEPSMGLPPNRISNAAP